MMWKLTIFLITLVLNTPVWASFYFQNSTNYTTDSDSSAQKLNYATTRNVTLLGATFLKQRNGVIGQNIVYWTRNAKEDYSGRVTNMNMLELGPRIQYFFDEIKTFYISAAYNIYAKGTRTIGGVAEQVRGSSYLVGMGYHFKVNRTFFVGLSMNYHSLSLSEKTVDTTETKISDTYNSFWPGIEFSLRFR